jgi:hypothetical protein
MTVRRIANAGGVLALALLLVVVAGPASPAYGDDQVALVASIDRRPVAQSGERDPIRLRPREPAVLELRVTNHGSTPIEVRTVRVEGEVIALTFFAYDTSVAFSVAPGMTEVRTFTLDLVGLGGQATGLIRGAVAIRDAERRTLASQPVVFDVRGSLRSVYGVFGLAVIGLTAVSLVGALLALARHQLPPNRWRRGLRFLTPGLGLGLGAVFSLSALRILVPRPGVWIPILLIAGGGSFIIGYLTPSPDEDEDAEDAEDELDEGTVVLHGETSAGAQG